MAITSSGDHIRNRRGPRSRVCSTPSWQSTRHRWIANVLLIQIAHATRHGSDRLAHSRLQQGDQTIRRYLPAFRINSWSRLVETTKNRIEFTEPRRTVTDGGQHWHRRYQTPPHGYRSSVAYDPTQKLWITVGPNGTDISRDDGKNWTPLKPSGYDPPDADKNWNALSLPFVVGPHGRIGRLRTIDPPK